MKVDSQIRVAKPEDVIAIYELMCEAFDETYLSYTIYQSPKVVKYLFSLASDTAQDRKHHLVVLLEAGMIRGYYHAIADGEQFFLNYIAVADRAFGKGYGRILLSHYEDTGVKLGCKRLKLDVFQRNELARDWYIRHGYQHELTSFLSHIALGKLQQVDNCFVCNQSEWNRAYQEESDNGFSKIALKYGRGSIALGLINGTRFKLLEYEGVTFDEAIAAVSNHFSGKGRDTLIVSSSTPALDSWPVLKQERVLRLAKNV
jgi:ribosomal protein S18 acetylase RimI-like enzyme